MDISQNRSATDAATAPIAPFSDRDREMFELRAAGWTLRQIGERYGISRQRVDEIVRDRGGPELPDVIAARRRTRGPRSWRQRSEDIRQWWRAGLPIAVIAERLGLPVGAGAARDRRLFLDADGPSPTATARS